ncbi:glycosyltransferase family 34 protein, partial [Piromyces sp. E2]
WVDGDVILGNPNIKLEVFVPKDDNIHFICATDYVGLNDGIFMIRVNSWSLNFMMRAMAYQYYHKEEDMYFADQAALNSVLVNDQEEEHYMIVPQDWFNRYRNNIKPGDFIIHFAGDPHRNEDAKKIRQNMYSKPDWCAGQTNKQLREKVLKYYEEHSKIEDRIKLKLFT